MLHLIEFYDSTSPVSNLLSCRLLNPDELVLIIPQNENNLNSIQECFQNFKHYFGLKTILSVIHYDVFDLMSTSNNLKRIISKRGEENCIIDIIGGNETLLVAAGLCAGVYNKIRIISIQGSQLALIWGDDPQNEIKNANINASLTVKDMLSMAAGEMIRCGHADWRRLDEKMLSLIPTMFEVYLKNRDSWPAFTNYMQRLNNPKYKVKNGILSGPLEITVNPVTGKKVKVNANILKDLSESGVITDCRLTTVICSLTFAYPQIIKFLCDTGSWLELFVFSILQRSDLFSDIEINPVISWDNDMDDADTINEVDLIAMKGIVPIFISCKSGIPGNDALNELLAIKNRFGGNGSRAILITASDVGRESPSVKKRADNYGIEIIDMPKLNKEDIIDILRESTGEVVSLEEKKLVNELSAPGKGENL